MKTYQTLTRRDHNYSAPVVQPQRRAAPPVDRSTSRADTLLMRHRLELEAAEANQRLQTQSARDAFELQRDRRQFEQTAEQQRVLQKRRSAPALIFDDSKEQD